MRGLRVWRSKRCSRHNVASHRRAMGLRISAKEGPDLRYRVRGELLERRVRDLPFQGWRLIHCHSESLACSSAPPMRRDEVEHETILCVDQLLARVDGFSELAVIWFVA